MRLDSRVARLGVVISAASVAALSLSGCATVSSGVLVAPPGVNQYSFRECLLDKGFYSPRALTGIAAKDWKLRHRPPGKPAKAPPSRLDWLKQSSPAFVATATTIIAEGLMPAVEYQTATDPPAAADRAIDGPYVMVSRPIRYDEPDDNGVMKDAQTTTDKPTVTGDDWRLNRFLDCYVAPVGATKATSAVTAAFDDDDDIEGRLLRAHILLILLTKFGTELVVSHASTKQVTQAELLLGHVVEAEQALRSDSLIMTPAARQGLAKLDGDAIKLLGKDQKTVLTEKEGKLLSNNAAYSGALGYVTVLDRNGAAQPVLRWKAYATRLLRVFQVGVDDERIDTQQTLDRAGNLIAAFSGSVAGFLPILKDGLAGAVGVQKTRFYGDAYLRDGRETLAVTRKVSLYDDSRAVTYDVAKYQAAWNRWDDELTGACTVLATIAKKDNVACVPKAAAAEGAGQ